MRKGEVKSKHRKNKWDDAPRAKEAVWEIKTTIQGIITASDWDEDGNIIAIKVLTTDESEYFIENGEMFMDLVQKSVEASGVIRETKRGTKSIQIKKCNVLAGEFSNNFV